MIACFRHLMGWQKKRQDSAYKDVAGRRGIFSRI